MPDPVGSGDRPRSRQRGPVPSSRALVNRFRRLIAFLAGSARHVERTTGITNAQLFLLGAIAKEGGTAGVSRVAELAGVQQSTASIVVARLERAGLVRREPSAKDGRRVVLRLTRAGRAMLRRAPRSPTEHLAEGLGKLQVIERRSLERGLQALEQRLGTATAVPPMLFEPPARRVRRRA